VSITATGPTLSPGAVIAAVDLDEHNGRQLRLAADLAAAADQPLSLMTVAGSDLTDEAAAGALAERARGLAMNRPPHLVVSRGTVADEIYRAARQETAGLVVMGLRERGHGVAGAIATKVAEARDAVVLAVPA
jgi:K+-sensing histidine kinase KdpD